MNALRKYWLAVCACGIFAVGLMWSLSAPDASPIPIATSTATAAVPEAVDSPTVAAAEAVEDVVADEPAGGPEMPKPPPPLSPAERLKEIDREHLRQLHQGVFEYKKVHGHFPEYLSQLVPDFVDAVALESPRKAKDGLNAILATDHEDPGKAQPSYGYEFSNLEFRDGRTFAEIKEVQRAEWGDVVPILRAFGNDKVINISYGGDIYETALNWEWDPATLDVVASRGWGPGLSDGEFTEVRVLGAGGQPLANATVWADGRNYSFDLPNRPFATDANGVARIPLGTDLNRTALVLRVEGGGLASAAVTFPRGEPPTQIDLTAEAARTVGGQVVDADGNPVANTWVYLKGSGTAPNGAAIGANGVNLGVAKTDTEGHWTASLHPNDAAAFNLVVGSSDLPPKFTKGTPVNAAAAGARNALTVLPAKPGVATSPPGDGQ